MNESAYDYQDPDAYKVKKNAIYYDKTQRANFRSKSLFQAIQQLKQQWNGEK